AMLEDPAPGGQCRQRALRRREKHGDSMLGAKPRAVSRLKWLPQNSWRGRFRRESRLRLRVDRLTSDILDSRRLRNPLMAELPESSPSSAAGAPDYDERYLAGIACFNRGDYFDAHEVWEELWMDCPSADRRFFQALIQAAVSLYHWGNGNRGSAICNRTGRTIAVSMWTDSGATWPRSSNRRPFVPASHWRRLPPPRPEV